MLCGTLPGRFSISRYINFWAVRSAMDARCIRMAMHWKICSILLPARSGQNTLSNSLKASQLSRLAQVFPIKMPFHPTVTTAELKRLYQGFSNLREAVGDSIDLGLHCHGEFDTPVPLLWSIPYNLSILYFSRIS